VEPADLSRRAGGCRHAGRVRTATLVALAGTVGLLAYLARLLKSAPMSDAPRSKTGHFLMTADQHRRLAAELRAQDPTDHPERLMMAANHEMIATVIERLEAKAAVKPKTTAPDRRRRFRVIEGGKD